MSYRKYLLLFMQRSLTVLAGIQAFLNVASTLTKEIDFNFKSIPVRNKNEL